MRKFFVLMSLIWLINPAWPAFTLRSSTFKNGGFFPKQYTCDGQNISPDLAWHGTPKMTLAYAILLTDLDAPSGIFYHWLIFNLPKQLNSLPANIKVLPTQAILLKNSWGNATYQGPCPPQGTSHRYIFTLLALDSPLNEVAIHDIQTFNTIVKRHILAKATLTGLYQRTTRGIG